MVVGLMELVQRQFIGEIVVWSEKLMVWLHLMVIAWGLQEYVIVAV
jgi:hypothetical protein